MPRSNKKKSPLKLPPKDPPFSSQPSSSFCSPVAGQSFDATELLRKEQDLMISRAIGSAAKHGIALSPGQLNSGEGNCAFESAIFNVNERSCFKDKLCLSPDHYRRVWMTDMKNKTLRDETWRIGSMEDWAVGWDELLESGVYERGIFGDLMLLGIACGLRKYILIFKK